MTALHHGFDAAHPPTKAPVHCEAVFGYVSEGAPGLATHIWTLEEWQRFGHLKQFPIHVCDLTVDPVGQAKAAVAAAKDLGWREGHTLIGDTETAVDPVWWKEFADEVTAGGFRPVDYGSLAYVTQNVASENWVADWDNIPVLATGQDIVATQYTANAPFDGTVVDYSVLTDDFYQSGGDGPRERAV